MNQPRDEASRVLYVQSDQLPHDLGTAQTLVPAFHHTESRIPWILHPKSDGCKSLAISSWKKKLKYSPFHIPADLRFQGYKEEHAHKDFESLGYLLVHGIPS